MIRKVKLSDADEIATIYNDYIVSSTITFEVEPLSVSQMRERIAHLSSVYPYFIYEEDNKILGFCYAHKWKDRAAYDHTFETTIYLSSHFLHRGIGTLLMEKLISECRDMGVAVLIACITYGNEASVRMHKKMGFTQVSHFKRVGMKFGQYLDVVDLQLIL